MLVGNIAGESCPEPAEDRSSDLSRATPGGSAARVRERGGRIRRLLLRGEGWPELSLSRSPFRAAGACRDVFSGSCVTSSFRSCEGLKKGPSSSSFGNRLYEGLRLDSRERRVIYFSRWGESCSFFGFRPYPFVASVTSKRRWGGPANVGGTRGDSSPDRGTDQGLSFPLDTCRREGGRQPDPIDSEGRDLLNRRA